ncbi:MAG TPA: NAD(P)-binding domain-containing protein [Puia sp.]|nr:NAD(P)-binding domain-containing protein [Puia sp.]
MTIGFIGIGNIAAALVEGFCTPAGTGGPGAASVAAEPGGVEVATEPAGLELFLSPRNEARSKALAAQYPQVTRLESNQAVLDRSEIVIVSVRPPVAAEVLGALHFRADHIVVSLVALLKYTDLAALAHPAVAVSRAIPMPAAAKHNCPIALYRPAPIVQQLFTRVGEPLVVNDEPQLHALWTLTGLITPFYDLLAGLSGWAIEHGVEPLTANAYTAHLFQSLAALAQLDPGAGFPAFAHHAATPGGLNEQAGREIRESGAHQAWTEAADRLLPRFG